MKMLTDFVSSAMLHSNNMVYIYRFGCMSMFRFATTCLRILFSLHALRKRQAFFSPTAAPEQTGPRTSGREGWIPAEQMSGSAVAREATSIHKPPVDELVKFPSMDPAP